LRDFVAQGAVIVGNRPTDSPSLADNEAEVHKIADQLWGGTGQPGQSVHKFGKGRVYSGMSANQVLAALDTAPDFEYTKPEPDAALMFVHRRLADGDLYFVDNRRDRAESVNVTFRVDGKSPELWNAATGKSQPVSYRIANGRTTVPLHLDPWGTVFVVFRKPAASPSLQLAKPVESELAGAESELNRNWSVTFPPDMGGPVSLAATNAPRNVPFDRLASWSENSIAGVRYFSGTATYRKDIQIAASDLKPGAHIWLDLGDVKDVADVSVNGRDLGIAWKIPYRVDVTEALKPGNNAFRIEVTNLWVNRMIGDQQPWALKKYTFADFTPYKADSPLLPSGLLGPVRLYATAPQK
jgi:hypothetical protein